MFAAHVTQTILTKDSHSQSRYLDKECFEMKVTPKWLFYNHLWSFVAICTFIFHKAEVQTVILRCLMGLNFNWFKSYGLRCSLRPRTSSVNSQKIVTDKWLFYDHIWSFFCQLHEYLSQNWDSDSQFEVLTESKS